MSLSCKCTMDFMFYMVEIISILFTLSVSFVKWERSWGVYVLREWAPKLKWKLEMELRGSKEARVSLQVLGCVLHMLGIWEWPYSVGLTIFCNECSTVESMTRMHMEKTQGLSPPSSPVSCSDPPGVTAVLPMVLRGTLGTLNQFLLISVSWNKWRLNYPKQNKQTNKQTKIEWKTGRSL